MYNIFTNEEYEFSKDFDNNSFNFTEFFFGEANINPIILENTGINILNDSKNKKSEDDIENINEITREKTYFKVSKKTTNLGRKRKDENHDTYHNKYSTDNVLRKIQVHFISFIITFVNIVLKELGYQEQFYKIDYQFKKNVNKKNISNLKKLNIGNILSQNISQKYKWKNKEENKIIYQRIKNYPIIRNIISYNYMDLFKNIYCKNESKINLIIFGSDININLYEKGAKMYKDLKNKYNKDSKYLKELNNCIINLLKI